jgi:hypothetical protein
MKIHDALSQDGKKFMDDSIADISDSFDMIRNSTEKNKEDDTKTDPELEDKILPEELT